MKEVANQLQRQAFQLPVRAAKMSWEEHVQRGHTPFRRDCQVCQEASAISRRHGAMTHPRAGVMSVDLAGSFHKGHDVHGEAKFMLLGTYTWLLPESAEEDIYPEDDGGPQDEELPIEKAEAEEDSQWRRKGGGQR